MAKFAEQGWRGKERGRERNVEGEEGTCNMCAKCSKQLRFKLLGQLLPTQTHIQRDTHRDTDRHTHIPTHIRHLVWLYFCLHIGLSLNSLESLLNDDLCPVIVIVIVIISILTAKKLKQTNDSV